MLHEPLSPREIGIREKSVLRHLPLVRSIAHALRRRMPHVEVDELVSAGTIGLLEALERYDDRRGVPFSSFAYRRIRGAILDDLRAAGKLSKSTPRAGASVEVVSFEATISTEGERLTLADVTEDPFSPAPGLRAELAELLHAVKKLPRREREILGLHTKGYTVAQIAELHGCSDSRASQLLSQARLRLEERTAA